MSNMPYIIAEVGFNHEGDLSKAINMVELAAKGQANAVKFQSFRAQDICLPSAEPYDLLKSGELSEEDHVELAQACREFNVEFLSTPFSPWAVDVLEDVGVAKYKIASMDLTNFYLLHHVAQTSKPIILSTGMGTLEEIDAAMQFLKEQGAKDISLLHCISNYPAAAKELELKHIALLKEQFKCPVGYSDHYPGTKACLLAAALGADIIETHFTYNTQLPGADHSHSLDSDMLKQLVSEIKEFKDMYDAGTQFNERSDRENSVSYRRGVYTTRTVEKGEQLSEADLLFCRPENAMSLRAYDSIIGAQTTKDLPAFHSLSLNDLK